MIKPVVNFLKVGANRFALSILFVTIIVAGALAFAVDNHQDELSCQRQAENREVIRQVVLIATEPGGTFNFDSIPEFENVPPETQAYLIALGNALQDAGRSEGQREQLLAVIPEVNC